MSILTETAQNPLSLAMREGSQAEHTAAENSGFMAQLLDGQVNARGYLDYLLRLRMIYAALETTGRELADHPSVSGVLHESLLRLDAIDADLDYWLHAAGEPADLREVDSPAAIAYRDRIRATLDDAPLFIAHHYTRYLGDLSGGQAIGRILSRTFDLKGAGVAFYDFAEIAKPKLFKDAYRDHLDRVGDQVGEETRERIVNEVRAAFGMNQAVFAELGDRLEEYRIDIA